MSVRPVMILRRLEDLDTVHCARCQEPCALFPAGQKLRREQPDVEFVCSVCQPIQPGDVGLTLSGRVVRER